MKLPVLVLKSLNVFILVFIAVSLPSDITVMPIYLKPARLVGKGNS